MVKSLLPSSRSSYIIVLGNLIPLLCLLAVAIFGNKISKPLRKPLRQIKVSCCSTFYKELHLWYCSSPTPASENLFHFRKKINHVKSFIIHSFIIYDFAYWFLDILQTLAMSWYHLQLWIRILSYSPNSFSGISSKRMFYLKKYRGIKATGNSKMRQKHLQ